MEQKRSISAPEVLRAERWHAQMLARFDWMP